MLSKREFLLAGGAGVVGVAGYGLLKLLDYQSQYDWRADLGFLDGVELSEPKMPAALRGVCINSPFLWSRDLAYVDQVIVTAKQMGATNLRLFINDVPLKGVVNQCFEDTGGRFNLGMIDRLRFLLQRVDYFNYKYPDTLPLGAIIALEDGYRMFHSEKTNLDYASEAISSPYFDPKIPILQAQEDFFTKDSQRQRFSWRLHSLVTLLRNSRCISAWEIGNELELPEEIGERKEILTQWYQEMIPAVMGADTTRPISTGLRKPWFIDENEFTGLPIVNTLHAYPGSDATVIREVEAFAPQAQLALGVTEVGVSERLWGNDDYLVRFSNKLLKALVRNGQLLAGQIGLWKKDDYGDNHDLPQDYQYFQRLGQRLVAMA